MTDNKDLWFNTPDTFSLCRGGSNGPQHPSQLYAIKKYVVPGMSFLDYGSGSGTTLEALMEWRGTDSLPSFPIVPGIDYIGMDIISKNIEWCKQQWPQARFEHNPSLHKIDQPDKSFDVVHSRHVVDHMRSFEEAMDEHKRVARKLVLVTLWVGLSNLDEHQIKNIDYRPSGGKLYPDEYTNIYSKKKVEEYLNSDPEWELLEFNEDVQGDQVIVLRRKNAS